jgi:hypothetical protein
MANRKRSRNMPAFLHIPSRGCWPSCSWWLDLTREEFQRVAAAERTRMSWSDFGRTWKSRDLA